MNFYDSGLRKKQDEEGTAAMEVKEGVFSEDCSEDKTPE